MYDYNIMDSGLTPNYQTFFLDLIYPNFSEIATEVSDMNVEKHIHHVKYINLSGQESPVPFQGVNIVVKTYSDGSSQVGKMLR